MRPEGELRTQGVTNVLMGSEPGRWKTGIPRYQSVLYRRLLAGGDVRFRLTEGSMAFDILLDPGADPSTAEWSITGAHEVMLTPKGELSIRGETGTFVLRRPVAYQESGQGRKPVEGRFELLAENRVGFRLGAYNRSAPLVIDPTLDFSTVFGGGGNDRVNVVRVDASGIYLAGNTNSWNFPVLNPIQNLNQTGGGNRSDAFVTKLTPDGRSLIWSTYVGGGDLDEGLAMAVNAAGEVWLAGKTRSANLPIVQAYQAALKTAGDLDEDGFVAKLKSDGRALLYSTYFGGDGIDDFRAMTLDAQGNVYLTGHTRSANFPLVKAWQNTYVEAGNAWNKGDAFLTKFPAGGGAPLFSTYLGGDDGEIGYAIAVDQSGAAVVGGQTNSPNFPLVTPLQGTKGDSGRVSTDAFITKFKADGSSPIFSTFLGGNFTETVYGLAVDGQGNIYAAGETGSVNFPTKNAFQAKFVGPYTDAFAVKLTPAGTSLVFGTYLGGDTTDETARTVAVDTQGNLYVGGSVSLVSNYEVEGSLPMHRSGSLPLADPIQSRMAGYSLGTGTSARFMALDGFISRFTPDGKRLTFSSYLGGSYDDYIRSLALSTDGKQLFFAGDTSSADFPATTSQVAKGSGNEAFVGRLNTASTAGGMLGTPGGPEWSRHVLVDTNDNQRPDSADERIYGSREGPQVQIATPIWPKASQAGTWELSNPHPVTGTYQSLRVEYRSVASTASGLTAAFGVGPATFTAQENLVRAAADIVGYDGNLRPEVIEVVIDRIYSSGAEDHYSGLLRAVDTNGDNVYDQGRVETSSLTVNSLGRVVKWGVELLNLFPSALTVDVPFEYFDINGDGKHDYVGIEWDNVPSTLTALGFFGDFERRVFVPLGDTNGDGVPDSMAPDLDRDGVPDSDLPVAAPLAGPANPRIEHALYFAQFGDGVVPGAQLRSQIVLYNLDPTSAASARISFSDSQGFAMTVPINGSNVAGETTRTIPAGGLLSMRTDGGKTLKIGSVTVVSDRPLAGVILFDGTVGVCGVGSSAPQDAGFVAPMERNLTTGINTGIAVMNLSDDPALIKAELLDTQGGRLAGANLELPGHGQLPRFVNEFAWDTPVNLNNFTGLLRVAANRRLAATVLQTRSDEIATLPVAPNYLPDALNPSLVIPAVPESRLQRSRRLVFSHFGDGAGGGYSLQSQILLANLDPNRTASTRLQVRTGAGEPFAVDLNGQQVTGATDFTISPGGLSVLRTDGVGDLSAGSVVVDSDQLLSGVVLFAGTVGLAAVGAGGEMPGFLAPVESVSAQQINSGIAVTSLHDEEVNLTIRLLNQNGQEVARAKAGAKTLLAPQGHQAYFLNELSWDRTVNLSSFVGLLELRADGPVAGTVLRTQRGRLATMPVTPLGG